MLNSEGLTFDQWVLFLAVSFRQRYRATAATALPGREDRTRRLPLVAGGKITVIAVNAGEAVHFLFAPTPSPEATACRHLTLEAPRGMALRDWALLDETAYKRFVERALPKGAPNPESHTVVFPSHEDSRMAVLQAADELALAHARAMGG